MSTVCHHLLQLALRTPHLKNRWAYLTQTVLSLSHCWQKIQRDYTQSCSRQCEAWNLRSELLLIPEDLLASTWCQCVKGLGHNLLLINMGHLPTMKCKTDCLLPLWGLLYMIRRGAQHILSMVWSPPFATPLISEYEIAIETSSVQQRNIHSTTVLLTLVPWIILKIHLHIG